MSIKKNLIFIFCVWLNALNAKDSIESMESNQAVDMQTFIKNWMTISCDNGDGVACFDLGEFYYNGDDELKIKQDFSKAFDFFSKACNLKNIVACATIGDMYAGGKGVKKDLIKAMESWLKACDGAYYRACFSLGLIYENINEAKQASEYYTKACEGDYYAACGNLSGLYALGKGVKQDFAKASEYAQKACYRNIAVGCFYLGVYYEKGQDAKQDFIEANKFYAKACDLGSKEACDAYKDPDESEY